MVLVMASGASLRLVGTNWDDGEHLHPDERYISTVADNIRWPRSLGKYLDVETSPLSPYNSEKGRDYIYGTLPLFVTKLAASTIGQDGYGELNLFGRRLGAIVDTLTIVLVFLIALLLLEDVVSRRAIHGALLAAALYAFTVTSIQHSHFFTTDLWVVFFSTFTFLVALRSVGIGTEPGSRSPSPILLLLGASLGLTVACKISGALVALPVGLALAGRTVVIAHWAGKGRALVRVAAEVGIVLLSGYVAFRIVSPYTVSHSNWLDVSINGSFRDALANQARGTSGASLYPPSYQWLLSPRVWSPFENLALWQLGVPLALAALFGLGTLLARIARAVRGWWRARGRALDPAVVTTITRELMLVTFVLTVFLYFGTRFVHSGRYLLPIMPLLAVSAAFAVTFLTQNRPKLWMGISTVLVGTTALYAVAFDHIYTQPNTRIAASDWIAADVPSGSSIADEHWDDPLPVGARWATTKADARNIDGYRGIEVPVFDPDDSNKLRKLYNALSSADYYVLSSPRAWNTIGRLPDRFPLMARFYMELFEGRLGFVRAAAFSSYPELFGIRINDRRAEEAFWVYDHPPVIIFRRVRPLRWQSFKADLCPQLTPPYCG
jgi:hypothetical protein